MAGEGALPLPAAHGLGSPPFGHQHLLSSYYRPSAPLEVGFRTSLGRCFSASWGRLVEVSGHVGVRSTPLGAAQSPALLVEGPSGLLLRQSHESLCRDEHVWARTCRLQGNGPGVLQSHRPTPARARVG